MIKKEGRIKIRLKLKSDEEYAKIDKEDREKQKESDRSFSKSAKEFDKQNKYWARVIKKIPEEIRYQIMMVSPFSSVAIMLWLSVGNAKERDIKLQLLKYYERGIKK